MADKQNKLKLVEPQYLDYIVPMPDRFKEARTPTTVKIVKRFDEFLYKPFRHVIGNDALFSHEELEAITQELKRLNKVR